MKAFQKKVGFLSTLLFLYADDKFKMNNLCKFITTNWCIISNRRDSLNKVIKILPPKIITINKTRNIKGISSVYKTTYDETKKNKLARNASF